MSHARSIYFLLPLVLALSGCGYHVGEVKPTPMRRITTIAVNTFSNETLLPRVEAQTADAVVKQFQQDGTYKIESADRADVRFSVFDRVTGALLMTGKAVGTTPFFSESDRVNSDLVTNQNMNYPTAAQRMAENLVSKVSEGW